MKKITAKHNSICPECGCAIYTGDKVFWGPDLEAEHIDCHELKEAKKPKRHTSRKTLSKI